MNVDAQNMYSKKALAQLEAARIDSTHDGMVLQQYVRQARPLAHEIEHIDILLCRAGG